MSVENTSSGADSSPSSDEFHEALAEYFARIEQDGPAALEEFRQKHPGFASRLGRQVEWLAGCLARSKEGLPAYIGPYRVQQRLGAGGMGEVYLAEQTKPFRRPVAVKVVKVGEASEPLLARFSAEIQALASLNHDGIAKVFEAGDDRGRPYFAMEYVPGKPITDYCAEEQLGLVARLRLFVGVCRAVEHAHRQGIIHRDLKPLNILAYGQRTEPVVKIIDFGLAKVLDPEPGRRPQTLPGQFIGTPDYMSPELVDDSGLRVVDTRADVYALGVVLYELLTGMLPLSLWQVDVRDYTAMIQAIREREPSSPSVRVEDTPAGSTPSPGVGGAMTSRRLSRVLAGDLDSIVMKALAKDVERRYGSVGQLAEDIQRYLRHEPVSSRPATAGYLLRKFVRRHRAGVTFVATLTVVGLASLVTIWLLAVQSMRRLEHGNLFGLARYLDDLVARDAEPPPARPENLAALQEWATAFDLVLEQRPRLQAFLAAPEATVGEADSGGWASGSYAQQALRNTVRDTLDALERMIQPRAERDRMRLRIDWAQKVKSATVDAYREQWARVRREVLADWGIDLKPQPGLVPLARDAESRLQEFALHLPGCDMPKFEGGRWVVADKTCPVFVLLPGGTQFLGAQSDPAQPHFDSELLVGEDVPQTVELEPFFASKYELTNGQWQLVDPNGHRSPGDAVETGTLVLYESTRPLVDVPAGWLLNVLYAWGMRLPTWQQWEYLARGGTDWPRWCGKDASDLQGRANLYDATTINGEGSGRVSWSDGFHATAPVGSFPANPFLLHDVLGNVNEVVTRQSGDINVLEIRGGSWQQGMVMARATSRIGWAGGPLQTVGVRPVIPVEP